MSKLSNALKKFLLSAAPIVIATIPALAEPINIRVEMRDGTQLNTLVYLPDGEGPFPTLVARTIYGPPITPIGGELKDKIMTLADYIPTEDEDADDDEEAIAQGWPLITQSGYALVVQNTRGRNGSDGIDRSWKDDGKDGYDLVEWVNKQSWSNGKIGLFGDSAVGVSAALAAAEQPPALDALFLQAAPGDPFGTDMAPLDGAFRTESLLVQGGFLAMDVSEDHIEKRGIDEDEVRAMQPIIGGYVQSLFEGLENPISSNTWMAAPLGNITELDRLMPFWSLLRNKAELNAFRSETNALGKITVPTSVVTLWQDTFAESTLNLFVDLEKRNVPRELLVVNGTHYDIDDPRIYPEPRMISWFDKWLKDAPQQDRPIVKLATQKAEGFVSGNTVSDVLGKTERYFFSNETLITKPAQAEVTFTSDPNNPVPTQGGRYLLAASGSLDQSNLIERGDTIIFKTEKFAKPQILSGRVSGQITVQSNAPSFDLSIRLLDVAPNGSANFILSDHVRTKDVVAVEEINVPFDMSLIRHKIAQGHQLAVMFAGTDFPAWDRNPQTGLSIFETDLLKPAEITLLNDSQGGSFIDLPFVAK